jgi:ubiquinone/menaquinone biosynthesis C-methylase UbiE
MFALKRLNVHHDVRSNKRLFAFRLASLENGNSLSIPEVGRAIGLTFLVSAHIHNFSESDNQKELMAQFGDARLYRADVGPLERTYFRMFGLADPSHFIRSRYFRRFTGALKPERVLDAGCGAGDYALFMAEQWPQARVCAVDVDNAQILKNRETISRMKMANIEFARQDITSLADDETYDLITCIDALEHIEDQTTVLRNFRRALKRGGALYLHIPLARPRPVPFSKHLHSMHEWSEHEHIAPMRTKDELLEMIQEAGLKISRWQYTFGYYTGELACSLFALFHKDTTPNRLGQLLVSPIGRILAYRELATTKTEGFALALLATKA